MMSILFRQTVPGGSSAVVTECALPELTPDPAQKKEMEVVNVYASVTDQTFFGLGGAATEAAAYTFARMPADKQQELLDYYFGPDGANYQFLRVSLDSCDFSIGHYEAMSDPTDEELASFSLARDERYVIPLIRAAEKTAGHSLPLMLSPWSPPAFMKDTGERNHGGHLLPEFREMWANYMCRYIKEYQARGFKVKWLTVQNECNAVQTWDSCCYTGEDERDFVHDYLAPALRREGLQDVTVLVWDHNKERVYERALASITPETRDEIGGMAYHWYTGDHFEALDLVRRAFPDKQLVLSECCVGFSRPGANDQPRNAVKYAHEYIGDLKHGANALIDWNLYLDQFGGPNHVANYCNAPVMCNVDEGAVHPLPSYAFIRAIGQAIQPGATRVETSAYTAALDTVAFRNPDGSIALVLLNRGSEAMPVTIRVGNDATTCTVDAGSIATVIFR